jgi:hypothetical protein
VEGGDPQCRMQNAEFRSNFRIRKSGADGTLHARLHAEILRCQF